MTLRQTLALVAVVLCASLGVASTSQGATPHGDITFAESPGASPNYILPFASCQYESVNNVNQFQMLMFRPLFWFGLGGSAAFVPSLSLADAPHFTNGDRNVTIQLKGWRFANGQVVDARSVMFFLNIYRSDPGAYCGYNAGFGIPDQVRSAHGTGDTVTISFTSPVNPNWLLYNYLSEITPLPDAWDRTSPTQRADCAGDPYGAAPTKASCTAVLAYLSSLAGSPSTFTGRLWQSGVDGPWRLAAIDSLGDATFRPNPHYSGPQKAQVAMVKEVAYASSDAEQADLKAGRLSIGYLDPGLLTPPAPDSGRAGPNWSPIADHYAMTVGTNWGFNFAALNFSTADPMSAAINQLYIRQALQLSVDQVALIGSAFSGYGTLVDSPLPPRTPRSLAPALTNPYPYDPAAAAGLIYSHGWTIQAGVLTCTSPGTGASQCGAGIAAGYELKLNIVVAASPPSLIQVVDSEAAEWHGLGMGVTIYSATFANVTGDCSGGTGFEICLWGTGWTYAPGYYPSGESLFSPGGGFNIGAYNDPTMTSLITSSVRGSGKLAAYAQYAAKQLPVLFEPQASLIQETIKSLKSTIGFTPNPLGNFTPEYYSY